MDGEAGSGLHAGQRTSERRAERLEGVRAARRKAIMRDSKPLLIIEHEPLAPVGLLRDWVARRGIDQRVVTPSTGARVPDVTRFAGVIALGSTRSAYDDHVRWIRQELGELARAVDAGLPVLGICFGAQALARSLGAVVTRAASMELGWLNVGSQRRDLVPDGPWFTWHSDVFSLPDGATLLARNQHSVQAFAHGPHLGVQFHPEATPEIIGRWLKLAEEQGAIGDGDQERSRTPKLYPAARTQAMQLFDSWYASAICPRGPVP